MSLSVIPIVFKGLFVFVFTKRTAKTLDVLARAYAYMLVCDVEFHAVEGFLLAGVAM